MALSAAPVVPATNFLRVILSRFISYSPMKPLAYARGAFARVLCQRVLDVLKAFSDFDHGVFARVFIFDIGRDVVLLLFEKLEDLFDRRIALSPGSVRPIFLLAVFQMQVGDAGVIGLDGSNRI